MRVLIGQILMFSPTSRPTSNPSRSRRRYALIAGSLTLTVATVSCSSASGDAEGMPSPAQPYPSHIHGLAMEPDTQKVLIASHEGLFTVEGSFVRPTGEDIDLMVFTVGGDGTYFASGHPGPGVDLPNPVGLISSTDGRTWSQVARGGESDFHTLTATYQGIIGFDGTVRLSADGSTWTDAATQISPYNLAGNPATELVVATTEEGIYRSTDAGQTWTKESDAPIVLVAAVTADAEIFGVLPSGEVITSTDAGLTWQQAGSVAGQPSAITTVQGTGDQEIWVATENGLEKSVDNGLTFTTAVDASAS